MQGKKSWCGMLLLAVLMVVTGFVLFRDQPVSTLLEGLKQIKPVFLFMGLLLMFGYVCCEALCTWQILHRLGHQVPYGYCVGYSFVGFYVSSVTPSATGGQPAQVYYMSRDKIPAAHGALNMMLIAACYQVAALIWGGGVWLLMPSVRQGIGKGLGLLLLYGATTMILLTLGMLLVMFLPKPSRKVCNGVLKILSSLRILKNPGAARQKLDYQLTEYARGAECVKRNPGLTVRVLGLCLIQQGLLFSVPWMVYLSLGFKGMSWLQVAGIQALLTLAVCNLPLPGAVGPAEGGFVAAFAAVFGADKVKLAMLASRGISFYVFLLLSFAVTIAVHLRVSRNIREGKLREMSEKQKGDRKSVV